MFFNPYISLRSQAFCFAYIRRQVCLTLYSGGKTMGDTGYRGCCLCSFPISWHKLNPDLIVFPLCYHMVSQKPFSLDSHWIKNINSSCSSSLWAWSCFSSWFMVKIQYGRSCCPFLPPGPHSCPSTPRLSQCYPLSFLTITGDLNSASLERPSLTCVKHHPSWTKHWCLQKL